MNFFQFQGSALLETARPVLGSMPFEQAATRLLPPTVSTLHRAFRIWQDEELDPGPIVPNRVWVAFDEVDKPFETDAAGVSRVDQPLQAATLAFRFEANKRPTTHSALTLARPLAAWLVLLDGWMETYVVIARARSIWSAEELASALMFTTPAFLPAALLYGPYRWQRVAEALSAAVADGPLAGGESNERHWREALP